MTNLPADAAAAGSRLPAATRAYLADPALVSVWRTVRDHLERRGLTATGTVGVDLDTDAAARLNGLVGAAGPRWRPGRRRLDLAVLDRALRSSAAQAGLVSVVAELTGSPLVDRRATKAAQAQVRSDLWAALDAALADAGLAGAAWVGPFTDGLRRSGLLTRAGIDAARVVIETGTVLAALDLTAAQGTGGPGPAAPRELGELATRCTGDAHGLDEGQLTARVVLRAAAAALGVPAPGTATARRELWTVLGVNPDQVSGTVLTWGLRPPGPGAWAQLMRARADLGLVTHLTLQELAAVGALGPAPTGTDPAACGAEIAVVAPGTRLWVCENPQVVQAAARAGVPGTLLCTSGNPSGAAWQLLVALVGAGVDVGYHGDFDWPGVAIAGRLYRLGVTPWRMGAADYLTALEQAAAAERLALSGTPVPTPWDERLAAAMRHHQVAVHEEALTATLLADLT